MELFKAKERHKNSRLASVLQANEKQSLKQTSTQTEKVLLVY